MDMCINRLLLKLLILISFVPKNYGGIVSFGPAEGTVVALNSILKLTCEISGFTNGTNAVLKRNGTTINSCTNVDFCNVGPTYNISNAVFTFRGEANRVILTINPLLVGEVGLDYECNYNSVPEVYTIKLSPETSTNFESTSIIESTSTSIFIESNAGIPPTDVSQLNTLNIYSFSSDAENFSSIIATTDRRHTSASFEAENLETIDATNASFFMQTTSSAPNSLRTSMSISQNTDSYKINIQSSMIKTETVSLLTVTIESGYQSTFDSILTEVTNDLLTPGICITTSEISSGLIHSALISSFSVTSEVYPMSTYTDTVSTDTITSDQMFNIKETTAIYTPTTAANVFSRNSLSEDIFVLQTTFDSITSSGSTIHQLMTSLVTSTVISYFITSISDFNSSFTLEAPRLTNTVLTADAYGSMMTSKLVHENTSAFELTSRIIPTNRQSSSETSLDSYYSVNTFRTFLTTLTHEGSLVNTFYQSFFETESNMGLFTSSLVNSNFLLSRNATSNYFKEASDSQFTLIDSELSGKSSTITSEKGDVSTTTLSYSSIIDTVTHTSDFVTTSHFNEQSVSVTQNYFLSSITTRILIQTSSVRTNEAENTYTERHSSPPTTLVSSMTDTITETDSRTYDDKVVLLTSTEQILLVTSSLNTLGSFTSGMENLVILSESSFKMVSRSSNEFVTSSSSLDTFSPKYVKTTTAIQHGLSESSKDDIFISAAFGTLGAIILVVLTALVISRYLKQRTKSKDEKDDKISNQLSWNDDSVINSYNKNYISREFHFNSSIHLPLHSYHESPYLSYTNYYKKNWDDNT